MLSGCSPSEVAQLRFGVRGVRASPVHTRAGTPTRPARHRTAPRGICRGPMGDSKGG
ncbi:hypothetical protein SGM_4142 [Streptomyces griseoaurantiacus M045]|uniref:Uncharacterized protein n=1 Tax=Streptomyces griseoaurantiacus M045 TaxID=996637 RepID=F3NMD9_9ACTN|nr:hypothetical protein SGM_4142 [Streptomyces griseoaurantiacus M045]